MDSFPVLRQQSQNKIRSDFKRMNNEDNKNQADAKLYEHMPSAHFSNKDRENKAPAGCVRKPLLQPGVSRIPVLAKSLHLQASSEFKHIQWEDKPLAGKAKKKKQCTRPVPFNFSQPQSRKKTSDSQKPSNSSYTKTHTTQPETCAYGAKPNKHQMVLNSKGDLSKGMGNSHGKTSENAHQLSGQSGPFNPLKTSATLNDPLQSNHSNKVHHDEGSSAHPAAGAEISLDNMKLLSLQETSKPSTSETKLLTTQENPSKALNDNRENFQLDHSALLSILRNEGVGLTGQALKNPQSKLHNNMPMRVSVMKSQPKAAATTGLARVQFSPDPAALQSILQNQGVKAGGPVGATPRTPAFPPSRSTSIYTAQRVPLKNNINVAHVPVEIKETSLQKWTPQRVRNTKHQPMSSLKWNQYSSTGHKSCKINLQQHQEQEIVQRLFDDPEDELDSAGLNKDPRIQTEPFPVQASSNEPSYEEKVETCRSNSDDNDKRTLLAQPRESVIFFSAGKNLFRAPQASAQQDQPGPVSFNQRNLPADPNEISESEPAHHTNSSVLCQHRDFITQKTSSLSPAVAILRKRLPPVEELRLDEEVATYTSVSVQTSPAFLSIRPRCGNPLASILYFEESTRFSPIGFNIFSGPSCLHSTPLHET